MADRKSIPRKPVQHNVTDAWGNPVDFSPRPATIRIVPQGGAGGAGGVKDVSQDDDVDVIGPALARVSLAQSSPLDDAAHDTTAHGHSPRIPRKSLDKPLPDIPRDSHHLDSGIHQPTSFDPSIGESPTEKFYGKSKSDLERNLGVTGIIDLNNSEDTSYHTRYAPAVTHETIRQDVHEVRHEEVQRDIHTHDVYHRILPVHEVEVLPPRHFIEDEDGTRREVPADQVSRGNARLTHHILSECFKDTLPKSDEPVGPRQFSARDFSGSKGDYREQRMPDGSLQTERWWVHPPTLQTGGQITGQTRPILFFHDEDKRSERPRT